MEKRRMFEPEWEWEGNKRMPWNDDGNGAKCDREKQQIRDASEKHCHHIKLLLHQAMKDLQCLSPTRHASRVLRAPCQRWRFFLYGLGATVTHYVLSVEDTYTELLVVCHWLGKRAEDPSVGCQVILLHHTFFLMCRICIYHRAHFHFPDNLHQSW